MKTKYNFEISIPLPPPVTVEFMSNPWLFFNPMAHIAVLKKITDEKWDIIFAPDVEQSKGTTYYGVLNGPLVRGDTIEYRCHSVNNEVRMEILLKYRAAGTSTLVNIEWDLETSIGFLDKIKGESFSLTPEHIFRKHFSQRIPEMLNLINYREQGREYLLEKTYMNGSQAIPYIKSKAREIKNCIVIGTSNNLKFDLEIMDEQIETIHSEAGNRENFGGEAILEILNSNDEICICFYDVAAKVHMDELKVKQIQQNNGK